MTRQAAETATRAGIAPHDATGNRDPEPLRITDAARVTQDEVLRRLAASTAGLTTAEARRRRRTIGPNAVRTHHARALAVLLGQLRSPLLVLLAVTAVASTFVGEATDALIIGTILAVSVGLGFVNEYRAERTAEALHDRISHTCVVLRDGHAVSVDVVDVVPGDIVQLRLGEVVPADIRLLAADDLACVESVLTGESLPSTKAVGDVSGRPSLADLVNCALMGTVVAAGSGTGVVVATGERAAFGRIATGLGTRPPQTQFQVGLRRFSVLLVQIAAVLTAGIFAVNLVLSRPILDALLFSLAIAVGISPQLLPAVVSTSLAAGSRQLARRKVLVKRMVCIEDLGDVSVLLTDKTGTLTDGRIEFARALDGHGGAADEPVLLGLLCTEASVEDGRAVGGNPLDVALWSTPVAHGYAADLRRYRRVGTLPFDHDRRRVAVVVETPHGDRQLIVKGAPEGVLPRCRDVPREGRRALDREFAAGNRVIAVASRTADGLDDPRPADEADLDLDGFLVFLDPPKPDARAALDRLAGLGVTVKIATGDNPDVAAHVCRELGLDNVVVVTGADLDAADGQRLPALLLAGTVFARVSPEQKALIVRAERERGNGVGFLGDGVNDALALHAADVGISVDSATDVAKDAADVILLEKSLDVLADGVVEGRRIFANTMKYVLMGTSSNFGNMFSAAGASAFLSFLPMLPSQILLNNLLYDASQLAIPTDHVDAERLVRPSQWDMRAIRTFMLVFGPISSIFDFFTFAVMLLAFHADATLFRSGWFVESLATQVLVLFAIRTQRVPFVRSAPSMELATAALAVLAAGAVLPFTPIAHDLGFQPLPAAFFAAVALMVMTYVALVELAKTRYYRLLGKRQPVPSMAARTSARRVHRRAARFTVGRPRSPTPRSRR